MLITFSGLDGSGKSTLIRWLKTVLEQHHKQVTVFHMNDDVGIYAYLRSLRDSLVGPARNSNGHVKKPDPLPKPAERPSEPSRMRALLRGTRNAIVWNKSLRRFIYLVDLLIFFVYRLYVERARRHVLIMDRYFYDTLVDVFTCRGRLWVRLLARITPTPSVPVFLEVSPEESYARKGEYSVEYLRNRWMAYQKVSAWVENSVVLVNQDLDATKRSLERVVLERMAAA